MQNPSVQSASTNFFALGENKQPLRVWNSYCNICHYMLPLYYKRGSLYGPTIGAIYKRPMHRVGCTMHPASIMVRGDAEHL